MQLKRKLRLHRKEMESKIQSTSGSSSFADRLFKVLEDFIEHSRRGGKKSSFKGCAIQKGFTNGPKVLSPTPRVSFLRFLAIFLDKKPSLIKTHLIFLKTCF